MPIYNSICKPVNPKYYDTSNSLTTGLVLDIPFYEGSGTSPAALTGATSGAFSGSPTWVRGTYGWLIDSSPADGNQAVTFTGDSTNITLTNFSYEFLINARSWSATNDDRIFQKGDGSVFYHWITLESNTATRIKFGVGFSTSSRDFDITGISANAVHHVVITNSNSISSSPTAYVDGVAVTPGTVSAGSGSLNTDTNNITIFNKQGATPGRGADCQLYYFRMWNRVLSSTEALNLFANPWRIYSRPGGFTTTRPRPFAPGLAR